MKANRSYHPLKYLILGFCVALSFVDIVAQSNSPCAEALREANQAYLKGDLSECLYLLEPCENETDSKVRLQILRLLAIVHLDLHHDSIAQKYAAQMLKAEPSYMDFPYIDPPGLTVMLSKYKVFPVMSIGLTSGLNVSSVRTIRNFSLAPTEFNYKPVTGFQSTLGIQYLLKENFYGTFGISAIGLGYKKISSNLLSWEQVYEERLRMLGFPISVYKNVWSQNPHTLRTGWSLCFQAITNSKSNIVLNQESTENVVHYTDQPIDRRKSMLLSSGPTVQYEYQLPQNRGAIIIELGYNWGLNNIVRTETRFYDMSEIMRYQHLDSDLSINTFRINVGFQLPVKGMYKVVAE